jgi:hypothetical protein
MLYLRIFEQGLQMQLGKKMHITEGSWWCFYKIIILLKHLCSFVCHKDNQESFSLF